MVDWELSGDPDPYPLWHSTQIKDGQNYAGWSDPAADEAIEKARAITDQAARRQFYVTSSASLRQQVPALLLYHPVYTYGVRDQGHERAGRPAEHARPTASGTFGHWYIVTRRITVGSGTPQFDTSPQ